MLSKATGEFCFSFLLSHGYRYAIDIIILTAGIQIFSAISNWLWLLWLLVSYINNCCVYPNNSCVCPNTGSLDIIVVWYLDPIIYPNFVSRHVIIFIYQALPPLLIYEYIVYIACLPCIVHIWGSLDFVAPLPRWHLVDPFSMATVLNISLKGRKLCDCFYVCLFIPCYASRLQGTYSTKFGHC